LGKIVNEHQVTGTQLAERLLVNPETGLILACRDVQKLGQKQIPIGYVKPGSAGDGGGYLLVNFAVGYRKYKKLRAHHIVWAWTHGEWPSGEIDHINGDRSDNRISNLRAATVAQNRTNRRISETRTSGFKWVTRYGKTGKWLAQIELPISMLKGGNRRKIFHEVHDTPESAYKAASEFAKTLHGDWFNPGSTKLVGG